MSYLTDMEEYTLQSRVEEKDPAGAPLYSWKDVTTIKVAKYSISEISIVLNEKYDLYDDVGITFYAFEHTCKHQYRLVKDDEIYSIDRILPVGIKNHLLLKRVDVDVG